MNLIDLRGRQDEPAVRRVLERSHGSTEALEEACAHYRSGEWTFIGWQEGEEILACAGAECTISAFAFASVKSASQRVTVS